ncbi:MULTISPECIES: ABC transporter substrate-binding protein [Streptomyces]|uniref:ABC transporter substrate-binding protein n=1 Tax=Streptomyces sudanensis TaxID=436397 RepID=A0ABY4T8T5_9ACTN|nr:MULTISPECIES: ABC transporter substrate-binding protein [Streptomyces]MCP9957634.1 ABC transporter substrate-binding protein [Streptomyces sudanensis]MCP9986753.1 ABC transporter substrate-binding protein [Streptomyces sudanensis]MCQ0001824.1 ABC transporter substrate-binding protein [Streptomyces sudanensis]URN15321.1 ABC transporter substrate-binding protein [Streptomyces sudanensis]
MRSIHVRIIVVCAVLMAIGAGVWQLLPAGQGNGRPIYVGTTDEVTSLDPAGSYDSGSWALYSNVYQSLLTFEPGSTTPVPDAASACGFAGSSLTTYECTLREGLTFSNGREVTARDVKYSFDRMLGIASDVGPAALFPTLDSVTVRDRKVIFRLAARDATFPLKLATGAGAIVDSTRYPKDKLREDDAVDGSGPYVLSEYRPGVRAMLEPNPHYRGALKRPGTPIEVRYFTEAEQLAVAWRNGDVDVTHRQLPPQMVSTLDESKDDVRVTEVPTGEIRSIVFNVRKGSAAAEKAVRQAMAALVDRNLIASGPHHSTVEPLYSLIPRGFIGHSTPFFDLYPDGKEAVDLARKLLRDANIDTPVSITYAHRTGETWAAEAAELRRQLEATGLFRVKVVSAEWKEFQKGYTEGAYDAYGLGWLPDFPDSDNFTQPLVGRDNALQNAYASPRIDRLIAATQQHSDRARAMDGFKEIQAQVAEEVPMLPLWQGKDYVLSSPDVTGAQYLSDGTGIWRLWELHWL